MIKKLSIFLLIILIPVFSYGQRLTKPKPVITKLTATWCNICGAKAWGDFKKIVTEFEEKAVILAVHNSEGSLLHSTLASDFASNLPNVQGVPDMYLNDKSIFDEPSWMASTKEFVEEYNARTPKVHSDVSFQITEGIIEVEVKTQFFWKSNRAHYLSVYVVENEVEEFQSGKGPEDRHFKVLRGHMNQSSFGDLISDTEIEENATFESSFSMPVDTAWNSENLEIAVIVWEKANEQFLLSTANVALEQKINTPTLDFESEFSHFSVFPNVITPNSRIMIHPNSPIDRVNIYLYNIAGQKIETIYEGALKAEISNIPLSITSNLKSGHYYVTLESRIGKISRKVILP